MNDFILSMLKAAASPIAAALGIWAISLIRPMRDWFVRAPLRLAAGIAFLTGLSGGLTAWMLLPAQSSLGFPKGAVIASKVQCRDMEGTWSALPEAGGRFVIGAGEHPQSEHVTRSYAVFTSADTKPPAGYEASLGGKETILLTQENFPKLTVNFTNENEVRRSSGNTAVTNVALNGSDIEEARITPPYIALYYCLKE